MGDEKEIWYADWHSNIVKPVTAKYKRDREKYFYQSGQFFESKAEAVAWKRNTLITRMEDRRKDFVAAERSLKNFEKKFGDPK